MSEGLRARRLQSWADEVSVAGVRALVIGAAACVAACGSSSSAQDDAVEVDDVAFSIDAPVGGDGYTCATFDAARLAGRYVRGVHFRAPEGGVILHHAALLAVRERPSATGTDCAWPTGALTLATHVVGQPDLVLPDDVGVRFPSDARFLVVQAHAERTESGSPAVGHALVDLTSGTPSRIAAWTSTAAPVPAIRPHAIETSTGACAAASSFRILAAFPHMHRAGSAFRSAVVRRGADAAVLVDLAGWDSARPPTRSVGVDVAAGDVVTTTCTWTNTTNDYVLPGAGSDDEMCTQGLVVVADSDAVWQPGCP